MSFHVHIGLLYVFFGEMSIEVFYPFFWVVCFDIVKHHELFVNFGE